jgi:hypothetical protein
MTITVFQKAPKGEEYNVDDLHFELIGIVDVKSMVGKYDHELLIDFFLNDHPAQSFSMKPCLMKSLDEKNEYGDNQPFGIFIATKKVNPDSDRPLVDRCLIVKLQEKYPFIHFESSWSSWSDVLAHYTLTKD